MVSLIADVGIAFALAVLVGGALMSVSSTDAGTTGGTLRFLLLQVFFISFYVLINFTAIAIIAFFINTLSNSMRISINIAINA